MKHSSRQAGLSVPEPLFSLPAGGIEFCSTTLYRASISQLSADSGGCFRRLCAKWLNPEKLAPLEVYSELEVYSVLKNISNNY